MTGVVRDAGASLAARAVVVIHARKSGARPLVDARCAPSSRGTRPSPVVDRRGAIARMTCSGITAAAPPSVAGRTARANPRPDAGRLELGDIHARELWSPRSRASSVTRRSSCCRGAPARRAAGVALHPCPSLDVTAYRPRAAMLGRRCHARGRRASRRESRSAASGLEIVSRWDERRSVQIDGASAVDVEHRHLAHSRSVRSPPGAPPRSRSSRTWAGTASIASCGIEHEAGRTDSGGIDELGLTIAVVTVQSRSIATPRCGRVVVASPRSRRRDQGVADASPRSTE